MDVFDILEKTVRREIAIIRKRVKKERRHKPEKDYSIRDYPAMVVACGYCKGSKFFVGEARSPKGMNYVKKLKDKLETLGRIGERRPGCDNPIGACAEPHAANKVLQEYNGCDLEDLRFSAAYRPRTAHRKVYCLNCKDTFPSI